MVYISLTKRFSNPFWILKASKEEKTFKIWVLHLLLLTYILLSAVSGMFLPKTAGAADALTGGVQGLRAGETLDSGVGAGKGLSNVVDSTNALRRTGTETLKPQDLMTMRGGNEAKSLPKTEDASNLDKTLTKAEDSSKLDQAKADEVEDLDEPRILGRQGKIEQIEKKIKWYAEHMGTSAPPELVKQLEGLKNGEPIKAIKATPAWKPGLQTIHSQKLLEEISETAHSLPAAQKLSMWKKLLTHLLEYFRNSEGILPALVMKLHLKTPPVV
ncbi:hypothetical protein PGT21_031153 [Puccinia graminis f. sp. tritici]|nr:hypothetical protein PGT21_031153 [Puccinia graminis f. sp. tritici]